MGGLSAPRAGGRPTDRRLFVVLGALSAFGPLTTDLYLPGLPKIAAHYGATVSSVAVTITACVVGLAVGQVIAGPVSDAKGRRRPLLLGVAVFVASSLACAAAPSVVTLDLARLLQGLAGGAGIVIARAMVRDLYSGVEAARAFSALGAVVSLGPILSPVVGGVLLPFVGWRGLFGVLAGIGIALVAAVVVLTRETLPRGRRHDGGLREALRTFGELLGHRRFMAYAVPGSLAFAALFAYISASSFVYQKVFGFSATAFGLLFGLNGAGLLLANLANARLVRRIAPRRLLLAGLGVEATAGALAAVAALAGAGAAILMPLIFVTVSSMGLIMSNSVALALADEGERAGSASALFGLLQFAAGAAVAPLVGLDGASAVPMALIMAGAAGAAVIVHRLTMDTVTQTV